MAEVLDIRTMQLPALRTACRGYGLSPAGGRETLQERLAEHLSASGAPPVVPAAISGQTAPRTPLSAGDAHQNKTRNASQVGFLFGGADEPENVPIHAPPPPPAAAPPAPAGPVLRIPPEVLAEYSPEDQEALIQYYEDHLEAAAAQGFLVEPEPVAVPAMAVPPSPGKPPASASSAAANAAAAAQLGKVRSLQVPELRSELRSRGLSPAGSRATLQERLASALAGAPPDTDFAPAPAGSGAEAQWSMPGDSGAAGGPVKARHPGAESHGSQLSYLFGSDAK